MNDPKSPIFLHSLHRSGSTYLFSVFRRSDQGYWCYQEPVNESLLLLNDAPERLLLEGEDISVGLRHPQPARSYYWEYIQIKGALAGLFQKSFSYDEFFVGKSGLPEAQARYFRALIDNAKGRPVLQFCRSAGRIAALKQGFEGIHIHLWREPRNQWWSFKVNTYFDAAIQRIYNAVNLPPVLRKISQRCGISEFHDDNVLAEFSHAQQHQLSVAANYEAFYGLWLYAFLETERCADITVSIDKLGSSENYRAAIQMSLESLGVGGIDFSDCAMGQLALSPGESEFFGAIELQIQELFLNHGYPPDQVNNAIAEQHSILEMAKGSAISREAIKARAIGLRLLNQNSELAAELLAIRASLSWRITWPLRKLMKLFFMQ